MSQQLVEILLATYNGEKYIEEQVNSILIQSFQNFRILVSDDGSTDSTIEILKQLSIDNQNKIVILDEGSQHEGVTGNFSKLVEASSSPYLMFSDQDDFWFPDKIQKLFGAIKLIEDQVTQKVPVLVHSDLVVVNSALVVLDQSFMKHAGLNPLRTGLNQLLMQNVVTGGSVIFNKALAKQAAPFPSEVLMHDWWLSLVASCLGEIGYIPEATSYYRQHESNVLGANNFGVSYIWNKFRQIISEEQGEILADNFEQAKALLRRMEGQLEPDRLAVIEDFVYLERRSFFAKRWVMFRRGFTKGRLAQNIGLFLKA